MATKSIKTVGVASDSNSAVGEASEHSTATTATTQNAVTTANEETGLLQPEESINPVKLPQLVVR